MTTQTGFGGRQEPQVVYIARNSFEADLIIALLDSEGIPAYAAGAAASQAFGLALGPLAEVRVFVSAAHAQRAEQIVAERHLGEGEGEDEAQFEDPPPDESFDV